MPTTKPILKIYVAPEEHEEISRNAKRARLTVSAYGRRVLLGLPTPSFEKQQAVRELIAASADLGRLGGLLKMWLTNEDQNQAAVDRLLRDLQRAKAELARKIEAL